MADRPKDKRNGETRNGARRITLQHVARECGVSASAVSIVLNNTPLSRNMAAETRLRVQEAAERLGYRPNSFARSLRKSRSEMVGIMVFDIADPFCTLILQGIQEELLATDYLPIIMDAHNQRDQFERYLELLLDRRVDGLIVVANWLFVQIDTLRDFEKNRLPAVIVGREYTSRFTSSVLVDNEAGGYLAMQHLHRLGHRQIAVIRGPEQLQDSERRWHGARRFAREAGLRLQSELVVSLPGSADPFAGYEGGHAAIDALLKRKRKFTAVVAFDDLTACGAMRALRDHGLQCPADVSVIGFDDIPLASLITPRLTTVQQHMKQMGAVSAKRILHAIRAQADDSIPSGRTQLLKPTICARESTARIAT